MSKLTKRVLGNISNVNSNINKALGPKRGLDGIQDVTAKKYKLTENPAPVLKKAKENAKVAQGSSKDDVENKGANLKQVEPADLTRTIESKVKSIRLTGTSSKERVKDAGDSKSRVEKQDQVAEEAKIEEDAGDSRVAQVDFSDPTTYYVPPKSLPESVEDFDKTQLNNVDSEPQYAHDVFVYYKEKELTCLAHKYLQVQPDLTKGMRAVLVDWMVEVQESFELNHETLYLAVKLVDHFLMREKISKLQFQLLGATAIFIAAKFDV